MMPHTKNPNQTSLINTYQPPPTPNPQLTNSRISFPLNNPPPPLTAPLSYSKQWKDYQLSRLNSINSFKDKKPAVPRDNNDNALEVRPIPPAQKRRKSATDLVSSEEERPDVDKTSKNPDFQAKIGILKKSLSTSSTSIAKPRKELRKQRSRSNIRWKEPNVVQTPPPPPPLSLQKKEKLAKITTLGGASQGGKNPKKDAKSGSSSSKISKSKKILPVVVQLVDKNFKKTKTNRQKKVENSKIGPTKDATTSSSVDQSAKKVGKIVPSFPLVSKPPPLPKSSSFISKKIGTTPITSIQIPIKDESRNQIESSSLSDFVSQAKTHQVPPPFPDLKVCTVLPGTEEWDLYWEDFNGQISSYNKSMANYSRGLGEFSKDLEEYSRRLRRSTLDDLAFQAELGMRIGDKKPPILRQAVHLPITIVGPYVIKRNVKTKVLPTLTPPTTLHLTSYDHQSFRLEIGLEAAYISEEIGTKSLIPNETYFTSIDAKFNMLIVKILLPLKESTYKEEVVIACPPEKSVFTDLQVSAGDGKVFVNGR